MSTQWIKLAIRTLRYADDDEAPDKADWAEEELKLLEARPLPMDIEQLRTDNAALRDLLNELYLTIRERTLKPDDKWVVRLSDDFFARVAALLEQK